MKELMEMFDQITKQEHDLAELNEAQKQDKNTILQGSIQIIDLQKENQRLNALASTMKLHLRNFCSSFEARFDRDPDQFVTEECYEYIDSAKFLEKHYGRVSNYVVAVTLYLQKIKV
jgi:hypothetical protein